MGYIILRLGRTKVALRSGCFCLIFSVAGISGRAARPTPTGDPFDTFVAPSETGAIPPTIRLNPYPSLPPIAPRVPPTAADTDWGATLPCSLPRLDGPESSASNSILPLLPTTFAARSRNRFPNVGLAGGGGGLRIPLLGGFGLRLAGEELILGDSREGMILAVSIGVASALSSADGGGGVLGEMVTGCAGAIGDAVVSAVGAFSSVSVSVSATEELPSIPDPVRGS